MNYFVLTPYLCIQSVQSNVKVKIQSVVLYISGGRGGVKGAFREVTCMHHRPSIWGSVHAFSPFSTSQLKMIPLPHRAYINIFINLAHEKKKKKKFVLYWLYCIVLYFIVLYCIVILVLDIWLKFAHSIDFFFALFNFAKNTNLL